MIELANDPKASRSFSHAAAANDAGKETTSAGARRARTGHAWPFLSKYADRPLREEHSRKPAANDSGS
jgi:hypothetical protein